LGIAANWSRENIAWCAALFEGEGCIFLHPKRRSGIFLKLGMTDEDVLRRFHDIIGIGTICGPYRRGSYKPHWIWCGAGSENVQAILAAFWPFLGERRKARAVETMKRIATLQPYRNKEKRLDNGPRHLHLAQDGNSIDPASV